MEVVRTESTPCSRARRSSSFHTPRAGFCQLNGGSEYEQYRREPPGRPVLAVDILEWRSWDASATG
jgi:hypothetical protein